MMNEESIRDSQEHRMSEITVSGHSYDEALADGLRQLGVGKDAVEIEELSQAHDDTLPGAEPLPGTSLRLRVKTDFVVQQAKNHLKNILNIMGIEAHIEVMNRKRGIVLNIMAGDDGALIIGRSGQTLDALHLLIHRMISKSGREIAPVLIDSENYREKRSNRLEEIGRRAADRAIRTQQEVALDPMPAQDRKIIHIALKEMREVHTISRGEFEERHLVVCPAGGEAPRRESHHRGAARHEGGPRGRFRPGYGDRQRSGRRPNPEDIPDDIGNRRTSINEEETHHDF